MNCAAQELNRIRMKSYLPPKKSVGGQTCQFWHVQESSYPSQAQSNDKLKNQIVEGVSNVTARIQGAIGQTLAVPQ
jgi:hypothetical protein